MHRADTACGCQLRAATYTIRPPIVSSGFEPVRSENHSQLANAGPVMKRLYRESTGASTRHLSIYGVLLAGAGLLSVAGCATIYKSTAGDYVDAAKQIGPTLQSADAALSAADTTRKRNLIATDRVCPVERPGIIYLLPNSLGIQDVPPDFFSSLIQNSGINAASCQKLIQCESNGTCGNVCYDADESSCIDNLQHFYNAAASQPGAAETVVNQKDSLNSVISRIGYGGPSPEDYLAESSVDILAAYLDLLGKAADGQAKDFQSSAKTLNGRIQSIASTYKSLTGVDLLAAKPLSTATGSITGFGALLNDISTMSQTAKDTATIKAAVVKSAPDADAAMSEIENVVTGDLQTVAALSLNSATEEHLQLAKQFHSPDSTLAQRRVILSKLSEISPGDAAQLIIAAKAVFKKARHSHDTLVQLVENPSNDQLKQIRAEEFASFRSAAEDLVNLLVLLK